jgi:NhaP-type Na+/H+ or K+/H+ antiporter
MDAAQSADKLIPVPPKTSPTYGRALVCAVLIIIIFSVLLGVLSVKHFVLSIRVAFADDQTAIFEEMRAKAMHADFPNVVDYLEYTAHYYPSGTKQVQGSHLDRLVERARQSAVAAIISYLRQKSGQDLGDDPEAWIKRFSPSHWTK